MFSNRDVFIALMKLGFNNSLSNLEKQMRIDVCKCT